MSSPRYQPVVVEHGLDLVQGGALTRQDELGGAQVVVGDGPAQLPHLGLEGGQYRPEGLLVARLHRLDQGVVELVELAKGFVGDLQLSLAQDTQDHDFSPPAFPDSMAWGGGG